MTDSDPTRDIGLAEARALALDFLGPARHRLRVVRGPLAREGSGFPLYIHIESLSALSDFRCGQLPAGAGLVQN
jgi:hypothetical protein